MENKNIANVSVKEKGKPVKPQQPRFNYACETDRAAFIDVNTLKSNTVI